MIDRDSRGHWYFIVRGEILGLMKDRLQRKHLSRMFSFNQERMLGDRRWSDTVVVPTVNDADQGSGEEKNTSEHRRKAVWEVVFWWQHQEKPLKTCFLGAHHVPLPAPHTKTSNRETTSLRVLGGVWSQVWNLKKLTEEHHQKWIVRLNLTTRGNSPGPDLIMIDRLTALSWFQGWWCMAVLSWWSDLSG